jgi:hypothetical protein
VRYDDGVQAAVARERLVDRTARIVGRCEVGDEVDAARPVGTEDGEPRAPERLDRRGPDPARSARDQRDPAHAAMLTQMGGRVHGSTSRRSRLTSGMREN